MIAVIPAQQSYKNNKIHLVPMALFSGENKTTEGPLWFRRDGKERITPPSCPLCPWCVCHERRVLFYSFTCQPGLEWFLRGVLLEGAV